MSYIRCLSNPEGLYIWGDSSGLVVITGGPAGNWRSMPQLLWDKLMQAYVDNFGYDVSIELTIDGILHQASIEEYLYPREENESLADRLEKLSKGKRVKKGRLKVIMSYSNTRGEAWKVDGIWPVTMSYIARNATNPWYGAGWLKRRLLKWLRVN